MSDANHVSVMLGEVLSALAPSAGENYLDATFGAGGYSRAILNECEDCSLNAIDRDPNVEMLAEALARDFPGRFLFMTGQFSDMKELLHQRNVTELDGIVLDIGVSSMQIDEAERGFSFQRDGALDMRMSKSGLSAADVVNEYSEVEIANIIYKYGEEKASRKVAANIMKYRAIEPIKTTLQLAEIVREVVYKGKSKLDPATRTFQALRIYVNDELGELEKALESAESLLKVGGRLVVVTFHSLEDRIVKQFFKEKSCAMPKGSRYDPISIVQNEVEKPKFILPNRKAILPSEEEIKANPRARSAKLRYGIKQEVML